MKTILSIDGGGMKGYIPCAVLVSLETRAGKPCSEIFDLVAGTSIGGILACLIASGKTATEALQFFTTDGPQIFGHEQPFGHQGIIKPRFAAQQIEASLFARLGTTKLADITKHLLVPAIDLTTYDPFFFKAPTTDQTYSLWQVARATSAAQTYFPAYKVGDKVFWDGGNAANNPAACAVAEAFRTWPGETFRILSLGCGASKSKFNADELINAGLVKVGIETMNLLFEANDELPHYILTQLLDQGYFRITPNLTKDLPIDGASDQAILDLRNAANQCIVDNTKVIDDFLAFGASKTVPSASDVAGSSGQPVAP